jgi:putative ABC transport system substrate-binding protein
MAAEAFGVKLQFLEVGGPNPDLDGAFRTARSQRAGALIILPGPSLVVHRTRVVELAAKSRFPAIYPTSEFVEAGGLMSYGVDLVDLCRRAATNTERREARRPPGRAAEKFEFIINLKAAKQIGLTIPPNVLARADKVIR